MKNFGRLLFLVILFDMMMYKNVAAADINPFHLTASKDGDKKYIVNVSIEKTELSAFGFAIFYNENVLKYNNAEEDGYTNDFADAYEKKGIAMWNALNSEVRFSGINADDKSAEYEGDIARLTFEAINDSVTSSSICLEIKNLTVADKRTQLSEGHKRIYYTINFTDDDTSKSDSTQYELNDNLNSFHNAVKQGDIMLENQVDDIGYMKNSNPMIINIQSSRSDALVNKISVKSEALNSIEEAKQDAMNEEKVNGVISSESKQHYEMSSDAEQRNDNSMGGIINNKIACVGLGIGLCIIIIIMKKINKKVS